MSSENFNQHIYPRVVIYRMKIKKNFEDSDLLFKDILGNDFLAKIDRYSRYANDPESNTNTLNAFLMNLYNNIGGVEEYDITPFVKDISVNLDLEGINTCSINLITPIIYSLDKKFINNFINNITWKKLFGNIDDYIKKFKNFDILEMDFVRIYYYDDSKSFKDDINEKDFFVPAFTGIVKNINYSIQADGLASYSIECAGMMQLLNESSIVIDQAILNAVTIGNAKEGKTENDSTLSASVEKTGITPFANRYSGKLDYEIFLDIIKSYFLPYIDDKYKEEVTFPISLYNEEGKQISDTTQKEVEYLGEPQENFEKVLFKKVDNKEQKIPNFIQFLNIIYSYHYVKNKFSEAIYVLQDMFERKNNNGQDNGATTAYLLMPRGDFAIYDASYTSPYEILDTIKKQSFYEIFEDRTGCFYFRKMRYNNKYLSNSIGVNKVLNVNLNKNEQGIFNVVGNKISFIMVGAMNELPSQYYINNILALRYGLRVSGPFTNPNALNQERARSFSKFMQQYHILKTSRSFNATVVGDMENNIGENIEIFYNLPSVTNIGSENYYLEKVIGYVVNIREDIRVDGVFNQSLNLLFLRTNYAVSSLKSEIYLFSPKKDNLYIGIDERSYLNFVDFETFDVPRIVYTAEDAEKQSQITKKSTTEICDEYIYNNLISLYEYMSILIVQEILVKNYKKVFDIYFSSLGSKINPVYLPGELTYSILQKVSNINDIKKELYTTINPELELDRFYRNNTDEEQKLKFFKEYIGRSKEIKDSNLESCIKEKLNINKKSKPIDIDKFNQLVEPSYSKLKKLTYNEKGGEPRNNYETYFQIINPWGDFNKNSFLLAYPKFKKIIDNEKGVEINNLYDLVIFILDYINKNTNIQEGLREEINNLLDSIYELNIKGTINALKDDLDDYVNMIKELCAAISKLEEEKGKKIGNTNIPNIPKYDIPSVIRELQP